MHILACNTVEAQGHPAAVNVSGGLSEAIQCSSSPVSYAFAVSADPPTCCEEAGWSATLSCRNLVARGKLHPKCGFEQDQTWPLTNTRGTLFEPVAWESAFLSSAPSARVSSAIA